MALERKDLLGLRDVSAREIEEILDAAKTLRGILVQNTK